MYRQSTHVKGKRNTSVGEEDQKPDTVQSVEWLETLDEWQDAEVDDSADGGVVVERDKGVHLKSALLDTRCHHHLP